MLYISKVEKSLIEKKLYNVIPADFGPEEEYGDVMDGSDSDILNALMFIFEDYTCDQGASKFVVSDNGEDFVIKIPFSGSWCLNDWENPRYIYDEETGSDIENPDFDEDEEYCFSPFYEPDYCGREVEIYSLAEEAGLAFLFAETQKLCNTRYSTVYIQEKAKIGSRHGKEVSEETSSKAAEMSKRCNYTISCDWLGTVIDWYGDEIAEKLLDFLDDNGVNDLHSGNVGYRLSDSAPILVDYSGFED